MAISLKTAGTWAELTADGAVTIPGSPADGDRMFLFAGWKDFSVTATDPAGWTSIGAAFADGSTAAGNGTGSIKVQAWYRDWKSGDGNPTIDFSASPNLALVVIQLWQKAATDSWNDPTTVTAAWPVTATTQTISASSTTTVPHNSVVMAQIHLRDDSAAFTRPTTGIDVSAGITWNGNYVESPATHISTTTAFDGAADLGHRFVTTGAAAQTLRVTATISAVETGSIRWVIQGLGGRGFSQAQAQIKALDVEAFGQAQAQIKALGVNRFAQAQANIKALVASGTRTGAGDIVLSNLQGDDVVVVGSLGVSTISFTNATALQADQTFNGIFGSMRYRALVVTPGSTSVTITIGGTNPLIAHAMAFRAGAGQVYSLDVSTDANDITANGTTSSLTYKLGQEVYLGFWGDSSGIVPTAGANYVLVNTTTTAQTLASEYTEKVTASQVVDFTHIATEWGIAAQTLIKVTRTNTFAQAQAQIKQTYRGYAQAQANIKGVGNAPAQAMARIGRTTYERILRGIAGLQSFWPMGEPPTFTTVNDYFGAVNGSRVGGPLSESSVNSNQIEPGVELLDTSQYILFADDYDYSAGITIIGWILASDASNSGTIIDKRSSSAIGWVVRYTANTVEPSFDGNTLSNSYVLNNNTWTFFAASYTNPNGRLDVENIKGTTTNLGTTVTNTATNLTIGKTSFVSASSINGAVSSIAIFDRTISYDDIQALYTVAKSGAIARPAQAQAQIKQTYNRFAQAQAVIRNDSTYDQSVKSDLPLSYWRLGESSGNPQDSVGTNHVTAVGGTPTYSVTGAVTGGNTAITFDGSTEYFETVDAPLDQLNGPLSWECWFKMAGTTGNSTVLLSKGGGTPILDINGFASGVVRFYARAVDLAVHSSVALPESIDWHHVVGTKDAANNWKLYLDGVDVTVVDASPSTVNSNALFTIGRDSSSNDAYFFGTIDEVAVYNSVLSLSRIQMHYSFKAVGVTTSRGYGQAQGNIKQTYNGFAQAQATIKATVNKFAQSAALISTNNLELRDSFNRNISDGFGNADTGGSWVVTTGDATNFDVNGSKATISASATTSKKIVNPSVYIDSLLGVSIKFKFSVNATATDSNQALDIWSSSSTPTDSTTALVENGARIRLDFAADGTYRLDIGPSSPMAQLITNQTPVNGTEYQVESLIVSTSEGTTQVRAKIYEVGTTPPDYTVTTVGASSSLVKGHPGIHTRNHVGIIFTLDDLEIINAQWSEFGQAQAYIVVTNIEGFAQAQAQIKQTYRGYAQAQSNIKQTYNVFAQSQADIKQTYNVFAQSQADIKQTYNSFAQARAQIKQTYNSFAQAQAEIKQTYNSFAQAQARILQTYNAFAQAQARILRTYNSFAQAQAQIKQTYNAFAQAQARILRAYTTYAQAQADIKQTYNSFAQAQADIKQTYNAFSQAQADIKQTYNGYAQAQAEIKQTYTQYAQSQARILQIYNAFAQAQADIKATYNAFAQAQADILKTYQAYAQAQGQIKQTYQAYAQAQARILQTYNAFAQAQARILQTYNGYGQSQADIKTTYNGYGQAQASITNTYQGYAQAQATILAVSNGYAQAQARILTTYNAFGQAQAQLIAFDVEGFGQALANIKGVDLEGVGQAQAKINAFDVEGCGQAQAQILQTYNAFAQAQAEIKQTYNGYGQSQADILVTYNAFAQAQAWIEQTYNGYAQSQGTIKATYNGYGQSQAEIKQTYNGYGQAQSDIKTTYNSFGQAQADILQVYNGYAQAQGTIKATVNGCGQSQGQIKQTYNGYGQAQALIGGIAVGYGQAQGQIKQTYTTYAQAQADIRTTYNAFAQSQATIKQTYVACAQAQSTIKATYNGYGQGQARVLQTYTTYGQAQGQIKQTYTQYGQSQADIKQTYQGYGQSQAYIILTRQGFGQAQAAIKSVYTFCAQAQGLIRTTNIRCAQAQGRIKQAYQAYAQAQSQIVKSAQVYGQAQSQIQSGTAGYANAQGTILVTTNKYANAQGYISTTVIVNAQAQALIASKTVFAQAQAYIHIDHILKKMTLTDRASLKMGLADKLRIAAVTTNKSLDMVSSDRRSIRIDTKDRA